VAQGIIVLTEHSWPVWLVSDI